MSVRSRAVTSRVRGRHDLVAQALVGRGVVGAKSAEEIELDQKVNALSDARYGSHDVVTIKKLFMSYDSDKDGLLDKDEVYSLYSDADVGNWLTRSVWVSETFKKVDKSGDDKLSWEEYVAASSLASAPAVTAPPSAPAPTAPSQASQAPSQASSTNAAPPEPSWPTGVPEQAGFSVLPLVVGVVAVGLVASTLSISGR